MSVSRGTRSTHTLVFIVFSIFFSTVLHVGALFWLGSLTFEFARITEDALSVKARPFSLRDIQKVITQPPSRTQADGHGQGGSRGNSTDGYARKLDPDLTKAENSVDGSLVGSDDAMLKHSQSKEQHNLDSRQAIVAISGLSLIHI